MASTTEHRPGKILRAVVLAPFFLIVHVVVPPLAAFYSPRDSDMGLWFCSGIILSELGLFGLIYMTRVGQPQWRLLVGLFVNVLFILLAFWSALLCSPMSRENAIAFLALLAGMCFFVSLLDLAVMKSLRLSLVRQNPTEEERLAERMAFGPLRFGTLFLLFVSTLSAIVALTVSQSLTFDSSSSYLPFRNYLNQGPAFLLLLATFFGLFHWLLLFSTLRPRKPMIFLGAVGFGAIGTELIRRVEQWKNTVTLDYLNWEFCMIVAGFLVAHVLFGGTVRWLGWELRRAVNKKEELGYATDI